MYIFTFMFLNLGINQKLIQKLNQKLMSVTGLEEIARVL